MTIEEKLTKENFWDELYVAFPKATQVFCEWVDQYKAMVGWKRLFNEGYVLNKDYNIGFMVDPGKTMAPKFHDMPYAMQMGIWIAFVKDRGGCGWEIEDMFTYDLRQDIGLYLGQLETDIAVAEYIKTVGPQDPIDDELPW